MEWLVTGLWPAAGQRWVEAVENQDETWRCRYLQADEKPALFRAEAVILLPAPDNASLIASLTKGDDPLPYLFCDGWTHPLQDGGCSLHQAAELAHALRCRELGGHIPRIAALRLPEVTCRARAALSRLGVSCRLRAAAFLPDMLALCALHPALTEDLSGRLYPLIARRHGLNAPQVERSLRLAIESTWDRAELDGLEAFFGHSVDPERGKPTNREFLRRMAGQIGCRA